MASEERLPPACAFAISVLEEHDLDPDAVPEEAVEASQQHMATCERCLNAARSPLVRSTPRKKKKVRRTAEATYVSQSAQPDLFEGLAPFPVDTEQKTLSTQQEQLAVPSTHLVNLPLTPDMQEEPIVTIVTNSPGPATGSDGSIDCQQCRQLLQEYAEALDSGQNVSLLYPEVQEHLLTCESGCLVLLDFFRQDAKATRKYRRRPVRDPFRAIGWELSGFFRGGQITMAPRALAYGTLILLLIVASLAAYAGVSLNEAIFHPHYTAIPTPDGIGFSDGLKVFDACNTTSYQDKRDAAQAMQDNDFAKADTLLASAISAVQSDTTGCNSAEAAIYRENLHVRQSKRAFGMVVTSFDSGPGNADPQGGTDRHILYAAYTQELVGAYIAQQQYNLTQMKTPGAPLLYLILANTTGVETGALQIANTTATLANTNNYQQFGLLAQHTHPLLGVLGLGPSNFVQIVLPIMCRAGIPLISPTATGRFLIDLINQTSLYQHCAPGFSFVRFSPDDAEQSTMGANYAYQQLHVQNAAVFYDPSSPSSNGSAQGFIDTFSSLNGAQVVARETAVASGLLDANGRPQASRADLLAGLQDALKTQPHPDIIFAPLLTNDVTTLAQAIARLPQDQQPILMIGGEFVQPAALQSVVQWTRQNQLALPKLYVVESAAARPASNGDWQKQFYASFCTSFATPGSYCSGAAALDQGALLFADGIELVAQSMGAVTNAREIPSRAQLVQQMVKVQFAGVSSPINLQISSTMMITSTVADPLVLGVQGDGTMRILN